MPLASPRAKLRIGYPIRDSKEPRLSNEYIWLADHPREKENYRGRYIAVVGDRVVASGTDLQQVLSKARPFEKGSQRILISRVSTKEILNP